jgi:hypothetical protein
VSPQTEAFPLEEVTRRPATVSEEAPPLKVSAEWAAGTFDACGEIAVTDAGLRVVAYVSQCAADLLLHTYGGAVGVGAFGTTYWSAFASAAHHFLRSIDGLCIVLRKPVRLALKWYAACDAQADRSEKAAALEAIEVQLTEA